MKIISILLLLSLFALSSCKPISEGIFKGAARKAMQKIFNSTEEQYHNYAEAYYNMGFAYSNKSDYDKAIECYKKAIKLNPDYVEAYYGMENAKKLKENKK